MAEQSYSNCLGVSCVRDSTGVGLGSDLSAAVAASTPPFGSSFRALELRVLLQTVLTATQGLLTITKRPIPGVDTSAVTVATLTLPITLVAGDVILVDLSSSTNLELNPGEQLKVAGPGGGTGTVWFEFYGYNYNAAPASQNTAMPTTPKSPTVGVGSYKRLAATIS